MSQQEVVLLLGSNLGNKEENIEIALEKIKITGNEIIKKTAVLNSEPVEFVSSNIFCNIAVIIKTHLSPIKLLESLKKIENDMGRKADSEKTGYYTDRIIDIDIVLYNNVHYYSKILEIPHKKHLFERGFSKYLLDELI